MGPAIDPLTTIVPAVVVSVFTLVSAATDARKLKIYNVVTFPLMFLGLAYHCWASYLAHDGNFWVGGLLSAAGLAFGFFILLLPYVMGGMSAGDVKLMMAIGAWLGLPLTVYVVIVSFLAAGGFSLFKIVWHGSLVKTWQHLQIMWHRIVAFWQYLSAEENIEDVLKEENARKRVIPFGVMLAIGVVVVTIATVVKWRLDGQSG